MQNAEILNCEAGEVKAERMAIRRNDRRRKS
jgi:hypothetical protein